MCNVTAASRYGSDNRTEMSTFSKRLENENVIAEKDKNLLGRKLKKWKKVTE